LALSLWAYPAVFWLGVTSFTLLASRNWRLTVGALVLQYVGVFVLVALSWPLAMSFAKMIAGWMGGIVLWLACCEIRVGTSSVSRDNNGRSRNQRLAMFSESLFRLLAAFVVVLVVLSITLDATEWVPGVQPAQVQGGLILLGIGLLQLGMTSEVLRVSSGLMTALAGFEIIYSAVELSALVAGLLAGVNLGIALIGAYLLILPDLQEVES